jgi:valyl-tRNA synthetase
MTTYKLIWDDFCSWYLEIIKPNYGNPIDSKTYQKTIDHLENILKLLHPFMPFLSEEIWHQIKEREEDIIISNWPKSKKIDSVLLEEFSNLTSVVAGIRTIRKEQNISNKDQLSLEVINNKTQKNNLNAIIMKLCNLSSINSVSEKPSSSFSFMVESNEFFIPIFNSFDITAEITKLEKELEYNIGFLNSVEMKLNNEKFVSNAPEKVITNEKNKMTDTKSKIKILSGKIVLLQNS